MVSLVDTPSNNPPTYFDDANSTALTYTTTGGLVIVGSAVPEPTSIMTSLMGVACLAAYSLRRPRRSKTAIA